MTKRTVAAVFGEDTADALARLAIDMLCEPPPDQSKYAYSTQLPWAMVREGREIMDNAGIQWRALKKSKVSARYQRRNDASTTD